MLKALKDIPFLRNDVYDSELDYYAKEIIKALKQESLIIMEDEHNVYLETDDIKTAFWSANKMYAYCHSGIFHDKRTGETIKWNRVIPKRWHLALIRNLIDDRLEPFRKERKDRIKDQFYLMTKLREEFGSASVL